MFLVLSINAIESKTLSFSTCLICFKPVFHCKLKYFSGLADRFFCLTNFNIRVSYALIKFLPWYIHVCVSQSRFLCTKLELEKCNLSSSFHEQKVELQSFFYTPGKKLM